MKTKAVRRFSNVRLDRVYPNPKQPRQIFDETEIQELADSMREHGVIEPIVVERCEDGYILHDGERRCRAARIAGLKKIPAIISPPLNGTGPRERLERALVANVQRSEMHPIEEGMAYRQLMREFKYSIKDVVRRTGKHYARVNYCLGLLRLEKQIQRFMLERKLTSESRAVTALLTIPKGKERIQFVRRLVDRKATAEVIVTACRRYNQASAALKNKRTRGSLAVKMIENADLPEWDALYQLGKVPPWPVVTESVMATCDTCSLRSIASEATCGSCPLVIALGRMMETAHAGT